MAKQITQKTFDDVVRENMNEFDMDPAEAVKDAVEQFESQGVNLNMIIKDASLFKAGEDGSAEVHPVVASLNLLSSLLDKTPVDTSKVSETLADIQMECDKGLSHRCLAGTNGAYPLFVKALRCFSNDPNSLGKVLVSYCSLVNGQPDLLDNEGVSLLIDLLKQYKDDARTEELVVKSIRLNCVKHEGNRQAFVEQDLILLLTELLNRLGSEASLVKEVCMSLRALTVDDDVRVPFGKAHENAKAIVTEGDALSAILQLCEAHLNCPDVLSELFFTLSLLAVRNEFCQEVMSKGGLQLIINAYSENMKHKVIVRYALIVMKALAGNDEVKSEICKLGGVEAIILAMTSHQANSAIAEAACALITSITLRNVDNCQKVFDCDGHLHIIQAMKLHPNEAKVQRNACMALRNLVARSKGFSEAILAADAESLLNTAMANHTDSRDAAKAALRDLGCKVELQEHWKGTGGTLS